MLILPFRRKNVNSYLKLCFLAAQNTNRSLGLFGESIIKLPPDTSHSLLSYESKQTFQWGLITGGRILQLLGFLFHFRLLESRMGYFFLSSIYYFLPHTTPGTKNRTDTHTHTKPCSSEVNFLKAYDLLTKFFTWMYLSFSYWILFFLNEVGGMEWRLVSETFT